MQEGSLITPSKMLLDDIGEWGNNPRVEWYPRIPEKDEVFVCAYIYKFYDQISVKVEDLHVTLDGITIHFSIPCWDELQPPMKVNIEELMPEENLVTV